MNGPHEDDLRTALHEAEVGVDQLRRAIELAAHGQENGPEVTAAAERLYAALTAFGAPRRCPHCNDTGRVADDVTCPDCPRGERLHAVPVAAPEPEVKG